VEQLHDLELHKEDHGHVVSAPLDEGVVEEQTDEEQFGQQQAGLDCGYEGRQNQVGRVTHAQVELSVEQWQPQQHQRHQPTRQLELGHRVHPCERTVADYSFDFNVVDIVLRQQQNLHYQCPRGQQNERVQTYEVVGRLRHELLLLLVIRNHRHKDHIQDGTERAELQQQFQVCSLERVHLKSGEVIPNLVKRIPSIILQLRVLNQVHCLQFKEIFFERVSFVVCDVLCYFDVLVEFRGSQIVEI